MRTDDVYEAERLGKLNSGPDKSIQLFISAVKRRLEEDVDEASEAIGYVVDQVFNTLKEFVCEGFNQFTLSKLSEPTAHFLNML